MREIKFRGKGIHSDEWCFGNLVNYGDGECEIQGFDVFHEGKDKWQEITVDYNTVGQFTGLRDCDGKEIYEGDVIAGKYGHLHIIRYNKMYGAYTATLLNEFLHTDLQTECAVTQRWIDETAKRVGGNVYDTPEFLKSK